MRVLFASFAHDTHFQNCVPLLWALRAAGHEVRVASQPAFTESIVSTGLTAVPVGEDHRLLEVMSEVAPDLLPYSAELDLAARPELSSWEFLHGLDSASVPWFYSVINNDSFASELVEFTDEWKPDLVLWEQFTFAGAVAARACGVPHVRMLWGSDLTGYFRREFLRRWSEQDPHTRTDPLREWLTGLAQRFGTDFDEELVVGQWSLDPLPARFRLDVGLRTIPIRHVSYNGRAVVPDWLKRGSTRRRVCLTTGSSGTHFTADAAVFHGVLTELARMDAEIVVTADADRLQAVGPLPDNVRVVDFVPLHVLFEQCAAVIHHGGAGSWSTALHCGIPQINLPYLWDAAVRARQLADEGAGITLAPAEVTGAVLRDALRQVLTSPSYADNASRLRTEALAEPSPHEVVATLEKISGSR